MRNAMTVYCLVFLASCIEVSPAWVPGDPPLRIWAHDGEARILSSHACAVWRDAGTGLTCQWPSSPHDIRVFWKMEEFTNGGMGSTFYQWQAPGWLYWVRIDPSSQGTEGKHVTAVHEMGHLLGIWEHIEIGPAIMTPTPSSSLPTAIDLHELGL